MILINGHFGVQTFFLISGWLLTFHFFQMFEKIKVIDAKTIKMAIFNRITRLWPTLVTVLAIHSTWLVQLGDGPLWDEMVAEDHANCRKYWWTNLLFINNLVYPNDMVTFYAKFTSFLFFKLLFLVFATNLVPCGRHAALYRHPIHSGVRFQVQKTHQVHFCGLSFGRCFNRCFSGVLLRVRRCTTPASRVSFNKLFNYAI